MPKQNRYAEHLKEWETTQAAVTANAAELPQLEIGRGKLDGLLAEFRELLAQQAVLKANKQQVSKRLRSVVSRGSKVTAMMRAVLKEHYGIDNEKLAEFGVQPFRIRKRKPASEPVPKPTEPPSPEAK
jgi:hypothetical protein